MCFSHQNILSTDPVLLPPKHNWNLASLIYSPAQTMLPKIVPANFPTRKLLLTLLVSLPIILCHTNPVPADSSKLEEWISHNIREFKQRKYEMANTEGKGSSLDPALSHAENNVRILHVRKDGTGDFATITAALCSIPDDNKRRHVIWIGGGVYREKITVRMSKPFITFYGSPDDIPVIITYNGTALVYGTVYSATVAIESDYFVAANVAFVNSAPMPDGKRLGAQAVAMRISGDKAAFYNCKFLGFQDTLCDNIGRHFFKDCLIQGTVDFIFGDGKSLYLNTEIRSVTNGMGFITAHARENVTDTSGFAFVHCNITGIGSGNTYLGRAWKERPRVVFAYTHMGSLINPEGWSDYMHVERDQTVYYGEYKCKGPGAISEGRVKYAKELTDGEVEPFLSMTYINGNKWLLPPPNLDKLSLHYTKHV